MNAHLSPSPVSEWCAPPLRSAAVEVDATIPWDGVRGRRSANGKTRSFRKWVRWRVGFGKSATTSRLVYEGKNTFSSIRFSAEPNQVQTQAERPESGRGGSERGAGPRSWAAGTRPGWPAGGRGEAAGPTGARPQASSLSCWACHAPAVFQALSALVRGALFLWKLQCFPFPSVACTISVYEMQSVLQVGSVRRDRNSRVL